MGKEEWRSLKQDGIIFIEDVAEEKIIIKNEKMWEGLSSVMARMIDSYNGGCFYDYFNISYILLAPA